MSIENSWGDEGGSCASRRCTDLLAGSAATLLVCSSGRMEHCVFAWDCPAVGVGREVTEPELG